MKTVRKLTLIPLLAILIFSLKFCQTKEEVLQPISFEVNLNHTFGSENLALNKTYTTLLGDEIQLTKFQYYISNIKLISPDGKVWEEKESYRLITVEDGKAKISFEIDSITPEDYSMIKFSIGVDPIRNSSGVQNGDLDPLLGMFWTWKTGYIFFKAEGFYNLNATPKSGIVYHIGNDEAYQTITLNIPENSNNTLNLNVDAQKLFGGFQGAAIDLKLPEDGSSVSVMSGENLPKIANNYTKMFSVVESAE